jgi:hypothetical protein
MVVVGAMQPRHDWSTGLDEAFWSRQRNRSGQPSDSERPSERPRPVKRSADTQGQIVRTLCVRLCDGYYWPISFATTKRRLSVDARRCESACSSPARLFFHRNPGQDTADMVDRDGKPYRELPAAFLYRTRYLADCTLPTAAVGGGGRGPPPGILASRPPGSNRQQGSDA